MQLWQNFTFSGKIGVAQPPVLEALVIWRLCSHLTKLQWTSQNRFRLLQLEPLEMIKAKSLIKYLYEGLIFKASYNVLKTRSKIHISLWQQTQNWKVTNCCPKFGVVPLKIFFRGDTTILTTTPLKDERPYNI